MLVIAIPFCALGSKTSLYVNGKSIALVHPLEEVDGHFFAPIDELGMYIGAQSYSAQEEGSLAIRTISGLDLFPVDHFPLLNGAYYAPLEQLVSISSASIHRLGSEIYIESKPACLVWMVSGAQEVNVRFNAFAPHQTISYESDLLHLRFYNCTVDATPQLIIPESKFIKSVTLSVSGDYTADLIISLAQQSAVGIKHFVSEGFYSVSFSFGMGQLTKIEERISPYITYHKINLETGDGSVTLKYLFIEQWRDHYKLMPVISEDGIGSLSTLKEMAAFNQAHVAISANPYNQETGIPEGLLIIDNQALRLDNNSYTSLGIDLFGRLLFFHPEVCLYLCGGSEQIEIDDLNRPVKPGELIMYKAGYSGPMYTGLADNFRVLKIKDGRVASVQVGPYLITDPGLDLLVARGSAGKRIGSLVVGDTVGFKLIVDQQENLLTNAVGGGTILYLDGNKVTPAEIDRRDESSTLDSPATWTVLATDWQGGLIFMIVIDHRTGTKEASTGIHDILNILEVKLKNAIAFYGSHPGSLVFAYHSSYRETPPGGKPPGGKAAVGLLLVPTDQ
jgi:hypothetical protein